MLNVFSINFCFNFSFPTDSALVLDAQILLTTFPVGKPNETKLETLFPVRHQLVLPANGLNFLFEDCSVSFNHSLKLDSDRWVGSNAKKKKTKFNNVFIFIFPELNF
jgi:hypothetical protein